MGALAIYHCSLRVFSRSDGHSAVAAAAYRAGAVIRDERAGRTHRYQHRKGVVSSFIVAPADAPENTYNRALLWNAAEDAETRKNSRVAREVILALPHELPAPAREILTRDMALWLVERYRVAVDGALHSPVPGDEHDPRNHHAHLLFTTREVTKDGLGPKTRVLDDKEKGPHEIEMIRLVWETLANDALQKAGFEDVRIDRRTLEDQGIDRIPQIHIGPEGKAADKGREDEKTEDDEDEGEDDGQGKQGSGGEDSKSLQPTTSKPAEDHKGREIDYPKIDQERTRAALVEEIKQINAERAKWPDIPLAEQIKALEQEMVSLDHRVHHFEDIYAKTSFPRAIKKAIVDVIKFSKELLFTRVLNREEVKLSELEQKTRMMRQNFRYHRSYRVGIHEQINTMKTRLNMLEDMTISYKRYKKFVDSIEKSISESPSIKFAESALSQDKIITTQEAVIKVALKADLMRGFVPDRFRPSIDKDILKLSKDFKANLPLNATSEAQTPIKVNAATADVPLEFVRTSLPSRERKDWFIPANDAMRAFQKNIDDELKARWHHVPMPERGVGLQGEFSASTRPEKRAAYEAVREKVKEEAESKRRSIPQEYKRDSDALGAAMSSDKLSRMFCSVVSEGDDVMSSKMAMTPRISDS